MSSFDTRPSIDSFDVPARYQKSDSSEEGFFPLFLDNLLDGMSVTIHKIIRPRSRPAAIETYRHIKLLKHLQHDTILDLMDIFVSKHGDIYYVTKPLQFDLQQFIQMGPHLDYEDIQCFLYQILRGCKYIHSAGVVHGNLHPGNILLNEEGYISISGFGLARIEDNPLPVMDLYCAPENMPTKQACDTASDIWSVACIFGELRNKKPLFPEIDGIDQHLVIMNVLGACATCKQNNMSTMCQHAQLFSQLETEAPDACDLMKRMLLLDPAKRIDAREALEHTFLKKYHNPAIESVSSKRLAFRDMVSSVDEWHTLIQAEITDFQRLRERRFAAREAADDATTPTLDNGLVLEPVAA